MQLLINIAVWSYVAWFSTCNLTDMEWDTFLPDMATLCPSVDVCGRTDPAVTNVSVEKNPCCMGCSCDTRCQEHGNCCFDDKGDLNEQPASCLKPSTNQELFGIDLPRYKFIANPPTNGCKIQAGEIQKPFATCSSDIAVAPWGNFYPVYSKSMNKFFRNEACALCHGADTADIELWSSTIIYTSKSSGHFISTMTDFYETYNSSKAAIIFNPPLNESMSLDKRCFKLIDKCLSRWPDRYYIPSVVQLNSTAISNACTYGPKATYLRDQEHAFKNVYCAICSGFVVENDDALECTQGFSLRFEQAPLTSLLDTQFLQSMKTKSKDIKEHKVCFRPRNDLNDSRCVQTFCPALQNRLPNGECDYPAVDTTVGCFRIPLNLSTVHIIDTSDLLNMVPTRRLAVFEEMNPWPNVWQIVLVRLLATANRTEFRLLLALKAKRFDIRQLTKGIEKRLTKPWTIHLNEKVEFTQSIHVASRWEDNLELVYFEPSSIQRFCISFSKLFYCQQIELRPIEYRLESKAVYLIHNDRELYESEYTLLEAKDGSKKVRVCLEDSGYVRVQSANDADHVFHGTRYIHELVLVNLVCVLV